MDAALEHLDADERIVRQARTVDPQLLGVAPVREEVRGQYPAPIVVDRAKDRRAGSVAEQYGGVTAASSGGGGWEWFYGGSWWGSTPWYYDPLFLNGGMPLVDFTPIDVSGTYGVSGSPDSPAGFDRFSYETSALKELYLCPRKFQTIQDVPFPNVTVTFGSGPLAGIPFIGSGSGNITVDFVRPKGDDAIYAAIANIHFDGPIGGYTGGVVGVHFARVDCTNGKITGGGIGFLY